MRLFFIGFPPLTFHSVLSGAACGFVALLGLPGGYICLVCEMRGTAFWEVHKNGRTDLQNVIPPSCRSSLALCNMKYH
jgi:hypothetical protein